MEDKEKLKDIKEVLNNMTDNIEHLQETIVDMQLDFKNLIVYTDYLVDNVNSILTHIQNTTPDPNFKIEDLLIDMNDYEL